MVYGGIDQNRTRALVSDVANCRDTRNTFFNCVTRTVNQPLEM